MKARSNWPAIRDVHSARIFRLVVFVIMALFTLFELAQVAAQQGWK